MPIRKLDDYLRERGLIADVPLASLLGLRVAIDGNAWLKNAAPTEPFHVAIGGPPLQMEAALLASATQYRDAGLKPVFVFHGLAVPRKDAGRGGFAQDMRWQMRNAGWELYYKGEIAKAAAAFAGSEKSAALNHLQQVRGPLCFFFFFFSLLFSSLLFSSLLFSSLLSTSSLFHIQPSHSFPLKVTAMLTRERFDWSVTNSEFAARTSTKL